MIVLDFGQAGFVDKNFTATDFEISQCAATTTPFLSLAANTTTNKTTISIPSELYISGKTYKIEGTTLTQDSVVVGKLSSIFNAMYSYESSSTGVTEYVYNGTDGTLTMYMMNMCFQTEGEEADFSTLIAAYQIGFNTATYLGTGTVPYSATLNDTTTYHRAYLASSDVDIYYSQTTNTIKYIISLDETTNTGSLQEYDNDSWIAKNFTIADFTLSQCNAANTMIISQ